MEEEIRVELRDLQKYFDTGKLDADTIKKRAIALRTGEDHIYIKKVDFDIIRYKYFNPEKKLTSSDFYKTDPEPDNLFAKLDWSKIVLGVASVVFIVIVYKFIALNFYQTKRKSLSYKGSVESKSLNSFSDSSQILESNLVDSKGGLTKIDTIAIDNTYAPSSQQLSLEEAIGAKLYNYDVRLLHLFTENKLCLWIYVIDGGQNMNDIATILCPIAKKYNFECVTIFDSSHKRLGRSFCN